jgi:hypothetical protein
MKFLESFDSNAVILNSFDSRYGCLCCCHCCYITDLPFDCGFSDIAVIIYTLLIIWCINNDINLFIGNCIQDIRSSLIKLKDLLRLNSICNDEIIGSPCCEDLEATVRKALRYRDQLSLIPIINTD